MVNTRTASTSDKTDCLSQNKEFKSVSAMGSIFDGEKIKTQRLTFQLKLDQGRISACRGKSVFDISMTVPDPCIRP